MSSPLANLGPALAGPAFATDGQRFYFTFTPDESDVWVMELMGKQAA